MLKKIRDQIEMDLTKIHDAVSNSTSDEIVKNVKSAIAKAKINSDKQFQAAEAANASADKLLDPVIEKVKNSKYTPLIISAIFFAGLVIGVAIGLKL